MCSFQEKNDVSSLSVRGNAPTLYTAHRNFHILCQMVLLSNVNFLSSKQKRIPKIDSQMLK